MATMTTEAAVLHRAGEWWEMTELQLDPPKEHEVLIDLKAAGLCHSDEHIRESGGSHIRFPLVGGHEGAGIVEAVGESVTRVGCLPGPPDLPDPPGLPDAPGFKTPPSRL